MQNKSATGAEALFLAAVVYAFSGVLVREVSSMWGDRAQVAVRFILVVLLLGLYALMRKQRVNLPRGKLLTSFRLGLFFVAMVTCFTIAIGKTTIANVLFVFYASGMISSFAAGTLIFKESVTYTKLLAMAFALGGLALYSGALAAGNAGIILSILAGIFSGGVNIASKSLAGIDRNSVVLVQYGIASVIAILFTLFSGETIVRIVSLEGILLTIVFALLIIVGSNLTLYGFQHFDVNIGSVIMASELVFAALLGYMFYSETPSTNELLGGILIFVGSVIGSGLFDRTKQPSNEIAHPD